MSRAPRMMRRAVPMALGLLLLLFAALSAATPGHAQQAAVDIEAPTAKAADTSQDGSVPVEGALAQLSDEELRAMGLERLDGAKDAPQSDVMRFLTETPDALLRDATKYTGKLPTIPGALVDVVRDFTGDRPISAFLLLLVPGLLATIAMGVMLRLIPASKLYVQVLAAIACWLLARQIGLEIGERMFDAPQWQLGAMHFTNCFVYLFFLHRMLQLGLAPYAPENRPINCRDSAAIALYWGMLISIAIGSLCTAFRFAYEETGIAPNSIGFSFWYNVAFIAAILITLYRGRAGLTDMLTRPGAAPSSWALAWPWIAMALIFLQWLMVEVIVSTSIVDFNDVIPASGEEILMWCILLFPFADGMLRATFGADQIDGDDPRMAAEHSVRIARLNVCRVLIFGIGTFMMALYWRLDPLNLTPPETAGGKLAVMVIDVALIFAVAVLLWSQVSIWRGRYALRNLSAEADESGPATRFATAAPLIAGALKFIIALGAGVSMLATLGVDAVSLIAGLGVFGIALGFGSQTLIRDIVSGFFFLVDDAFRKGEFIEVGGALGTVENIALRSMRLRHHHGALHTIPYGEISKLTNYSRDWVVVKMVFNVPFETDAEKVRKLFKKIGQMLIDDPEIGPDFLEPFKSNGVQDVNADGIVIRGSFSAKPGTQFGIRKRIYTEVQRVFRENSIPFARRQVHVQVNNETEQTDSNNITQAAGAAALIAQRAAGN